MSIVNQLLSGSHHNMSNVFRYSIRRVNQKENLAEHSFYVAFLADLIAEDIVNKNPSISIDREKILRFGLLHDFEETVTGDIVSPPKYRSETLRKELETVGQEMLEETLAADFIGNEHIKNKILNTVTEYEQFKYSNLENSIVKFADMLQCLSYSLIEFKSGNSFLKDIIFNSYEGIISKFGDHPILSPYCEDLKKIDLQLIA